MISAQFEIVTIEPSEAIVDSCAPTSKPAQPSERTMVLKPRICESEAVKDTPPLVTMPPKMQVLMPAR